MRMKILMASVMMFVVSGAYAQFVLDAPGVKKNDKTDTKKEEVKKEIKTVEASTALPFNVKLGGHQAVAKGDEAFATVEKPVSGDAELEVSVDNPEMVIANVFPLDESGKPKEGAAAIIIMFQKSNKGKLDQAEDKTKIPAGAYFMNIVAGGKTARVVFKVK